jgi:hypothetical protein
MPCACHVDEAVFGLLESSTARSRRSSLFSLEEQERLAGLLPPVDALFVTDSKRA